MTLGLSGNHTQILILNILLYQPSSASNHSLKIPEFNQIPFQYEGL